jgi:hypothetical protein
MCVQCWTVAATAVTGATGLRAVLASRRPSWLSPGRLRAITVGLLTIAVLAAGVRV